MVKLKKYFSKEHVIISISAVVFLLAAASCASTDSKGLTDVCVTVYNTPVDFSESGYLGYLRTCPSHQHPVFFAASQRMADRNKEVTAALLKASEQASKYVAVKAVSKFYTEKMNSSIRYLHDLDVLWDKDLALQMLDRLKVLDIVQDTYGTYLTVELSDVQMNEVCWNSSFSKGAPVWTSKIPEIPGYIISVGIALQTGYTADSFAAADDQALEDLARQISVEVSTGKKLIENARGTASLQTNFETAEVVIPEFYILERWRTPDTRYYYSLAIAPESIIDKYRDD